MTLLSVLTKVKLQLWHYMTCRHSFKLVSFFKTAILNLEKNGDFYVIVLLFKICQVIIDNHELLV